MCIQHKSTSPTPHLLFHKSSVWPSGTQLHKEMLRCIIFPECSFFSPQQQYEVFMLCFETATQHALRLNYGKLYPDGLQGCYSALLRRKGVFMTVGGFTETLYFEHFHFPVGASLKQSSQTCQSALFPLCISRVFKLCRFGDPPFRLSANPGTPEIKR